MTLHDFLQKQNPRLRIFVGAETCFFVIDSAKWLLKQEQLLPYMNLEVMEIFKRVDKTGVNVVIDATGQGKFWDLKEWDAYFENREIEPYLDTITKTIKPVPPEVKKRGWKKSDSKVL